MTNIVPPAELLTLIAKAESYRPRVYDDAQPDVVLGPGVTIKGTLTVGFGTNLYQGISLAEARQMMLARAVVAMFTAAGVLGDSFWEKLDQVRQWALADMCYELGGGGFQKFTKMLAAVREGDWKTAAAEAKNSDWYKESGERGVRDVAMLLTGVIPS